MDNDAVGVPIDMACHSAITFQSNSHDLNNQNNIMAEFPALSMMHDELLNNLHEGLHLPNHAGIATSSARIPGSTSQLERIDIGDNNSLIGRSYPISNIEDYFFDTVRSSLGNSANYGYDGMLGDINSKWDFNKFPAPQLPGPIPQTTGHEPFQIMGSVDQNGWISESTGLSSESTSGSSRYSNELSLTLCGTTIPEQCLEMTGSVQTCSKSKSLSLGFGYEPVHFSQSLSGSRFLNEMQEILSEIARYSLGNSGLFSYPVSTGIGVTFSGPPARRSYTAMDPDDLPDGNDPMLIRREVEAKKKHLGNDPMLIRREVESKKKHLVELLQLVDNRYNKCLDEIHKVISAFHAVTELDPHTHTRFALQAISLLHKSLRERISNNILAMGAHFSEGGRGEEEISFETSFIQKQWALQQLKRNEHQLWRPQRGLPERSVSVLRAWMFQNFLHPYPKDAEKHLLAVKSGLTRSQVSNWFINARVRLWKPLIDEMYSEIRRRKARRSDEETGTQHRNLLSMDNLQRFRIN